MLTQLGTYCQRFDSTLRPLLAGFQHALQALEAADPSLPGKPLRAPLRELQHQLLALCDKVLEQQAYVLIFGPLKSGKSTLMNAIAGTYVSEVSSLPAYPCLVFVSAGGAREYTITRYDGSTEVFAHPRDLAAHIDQAHGELAAAIRAAEQRGTTFDPQEHFPRAIRRVDVRVPGSELASTGAVLVDTPGLYTRMRFGYDRMTRDFRNAAACAIFVVKSDTLFLEQVFAEFQQLLDLFSRIFLVVNIDSHKRDVSPDGKLVPSLEQSQPEAVLRAFEQLAMSAPLQQAAAAGKVRMYPVDLLHAASNVLQKADPAQAPAGFRAFRQDLADYLASSDYLAAFLRDSLQRGRSLLGETTQQLDGQETRRLQAALAEVEERLAWTAGERQRVQQALQFDWAPSFARGLRDIDAEIERCARDAGAKLLRTLGASIDTWFLSSHSLDWLMSGQWIPLVRDHREEVFAAGRRAFDAMVGQADAGLDLPEGLPELLRRAGIDIRQTLAQAVASLGRVQWPKGTMVQVDLTQLPLKRSVVDVVAFRSLAAVRTRVLGPADKPDVKIPAKDKATRLGEPGRLYLHQCVGQFRSTLLPETIGLLREHFGPRLVGAAAAALRDALAGYEPRLAAQHAELEAARGRLLAVATPLRALHAAAALLEPRLQELGAAFDQDVVRQPKAVVLTPAARPAREPAPGRSAQRS
jgi:energy-coupling factor transporter ATP-binding protein EcfA2